jgi:ubiquitin carboxyl-terminal hydrolase 14
VIFSLSLVNVQGVALSAGLKNMGNTCYMNATVQCFRHMPELREALTPIRASSVGTAFTGVLRDTFKTLDSAGASVFPVQLVSSLRSNFPQFAQTAQNGAFMQQDAEEFLNVLTQSVVEGLASLTSSVNPEYDRLLGVNMEEQQICQETDLEPVINKTERANKVVCNIQKAQAAGVDLNASLSAVDHLHDGVKLGENSGTPSVTLILT